LQKWTEADDSRVRSGAHRGVGGKNRDPKPLNRKDAKTAKKTEKSDRHKEAQKAQKAQKVLGPTQRSSEWQIP